MADERWSDDRLDQAIDAVARRMTDRAPATGLTARIAARRERRRALLVPVWQLASAVALIALVVFAGVRLWPRPVQQQVAAPTVAHQGAPLTRRGPLTNTAPATPPQQPAVVTARRRPPQRITIDRDSQDIPALEAPAPLSVDAAPIAQLSITPLDVKELSVPPLEPDMRPR